MSRRPRARPLTGRFRCAGAQGCGEIIEGTWASAQRHADQHGGARLEALLPTEVLGTEQAVVVHELEDPEGLLCGVAFPSVGEALGILCDLPLDHEQLRHHATWTVENLTAGTKASWAVEWELLDLDTGVL